MEVRAIQALAVDDVADSHGGKIPPAQSEVSSPDMPLPLGLVAQRPGDATEP